MTSKLWAIFLFCAVALLCSAAQAVCEESSKTKLGSEEFFVVCQSALTNPLSYTLTKFISDNASYGVLRFRAGRQGFFCASHSAVESTCHTSNFGLLPKGAIKSEDGYEYTVVDLQNLEPVTNPEASYPRSNRPKDDSACYFALKKRSIVLGINLDNPFGLSQCLIALEGALKRR